MTGPEAKQSCQRRLVIVSLIAALCAIVVAGSTGYLAMSNANDVAELERADTALSREAAARQCARGNITRAELHVAYRPQPKSPAVQLAPKLEPVLQFLLKAAEASRAEGLERVRATQPILECTPNLVGREATPLTTAAQARFVDLYLKKKLDPTPEADDVLKGFDTEIEPQSKLPGG